MKRKIFLSSLLLLLVAALCLSLAACSGEKTFRFVSDVEGVTLPADVKVKAGDTLTLPDGLTVDGEVFKAWNVEGDQYAAGAKLAVTNDLPATVSVKAVFQRHNTVTFTAPSTAQVTLPAATKVITTQKLKLPDAIADETEVFKTWQIGGTNYAPGDEYTAAADGDIEVKAIFENHNTVHFASDVTAAMPADMDVVTGKSFQLPAAVTAEGEAFETWYVGDKAYAPGTKYTIDADLENNYIEVKASWYQEAKILFVDVDGTTEILDPIVVSKLDVSEGKLTIELPAEQYVDGLKIKTWTIGSKNYAPNEEYTFSAAEEVTACVEFYPQHTVFFTDMTGKLVDKYIVNETDKVMPSSTSPIYDYLVEPIAHKLSGWTFDFENKPITEDTLIHATTTKYVGSDASLFTFNEVLNEEGTIEYAVAKKDGAVYGDNVYIPDSFNGLPVTAIAVSGFANMGAANGRDNRYEEGVTGEPFSVLYIPGTIKTIGDSAFDANYYIKTLYLEEGIKSIGKNAFRPGTSAKADIGIVGELVLPASLDILGADAFKFNSLITKVTFNGKGSLDIKGTSVFLANSSLEEVDFGERSYTQMPMFYSTSNTSTCANLKRVILPHNIEKIPASMFKNTGLKEIAIPATVTEIGASAFSGCIDLETITFADSDADLTFGNYAFAVEENKNMLTKERYDKIKSVAMKSFVFPARTVSIGTQIFNYNIDMVYDLSKITKNFEIKPGAFTTFYHASATGYGGLTTSGTTTLASASAPIIENAQMTLTIPANCTKIGRFAFAGANLNGVTFKEGFQGDWAYAFAYCQKLGTITLAPNMTVIPENAFMGGTGINKYLTAEVMASDSFPTTIGNVASVPGSSAIVDFTVPKQVTAIGNNAFSGQIAIASFTFDPESELKTIGDGALAIMQGVNVTNKSLTTIKFPMSLETIGTSFMRNYIGITEIDLTNTSLKLIDSDAFCHYTGFQEVLDYEGLTVKFPSTLKTIGSSFGVMVGIKDVIFAPNTKLESIGAKFLAGNLSQNGSAVVGYGEPPFTYNKITSIDLPVVTEKVDANFLVSNPQLKIVTAAAGGILLVEDNVIYKKNLDAETGEIVSYEVIGIAGGYEGKATNVDGAEYKAVTLKEGTIKILTNAFSGSSVEYVGIPASLTTLEAGAFAGSGLKYAKVPSTVTTVTTDLFKRSVKLEKVVYEGATLGKDAFNNCYNIKEVVIGANTALSGNGVFSNMGIKGTYNGVETNYNKEVQGAEGPSNAIKVYLKGAFKDISPNLPANTFIQLGVTFYVDTAEIKELYDSSAKWYVADNKDATKFTVFKVVEAAA